ncbi:hypothetical protein PF007_g19317 [Phytophthora fragariae]|uniref:Uncharacterized protein n=1 Tax=Phytophthora fragariae TaxID=53985 RepID=A0A6A3R7K6_9STRA|nr:hypothetical protein PF007_g19317 [Phytophthora fragariae]
MYVIPCVAVTTYWLVATGSRASWRSGSVMEAARRSCRCRAIMVFRSPSGTGRADACSWLWSRAT